MTRHALIAAFSLLTSMLALGCEAGPRGTEGLEVLEASRCSAFCSQEGPDAPADMDPETTCFDGCNHCSCTETGLRGCTDNVCDDAG